MKKYKMAFLNDYQGVALSSAPWDRVSDQVDFVAFNKHIDDVDDLVRELESFDIVFAMRERTAFTAEILARLPNLKLIATAGPVNAAIDVRAANALGKFVTGTGYSSSSTSELTWSLILLSAYRIHEQVAFVRAGGWQYALGSELAGKVLGVIGVGGVGSTVARVGAAFGMKVVAWSANLTAERAAACGAQLVSKEALISMSDIITIHLRLSERSRDLIRAAELAAMKPTAHLINTSRGPIVNEDALIAALSEGQIAGAALDAYAVEPLPQDHPFRSLPNVIASPHIGYVTAEHYELIFRHSLENVEAWLKGAPIRPVPDVRDLGASGLPDWISAS